MKHLRGSCSIDVALAVAMPKVAVTQYLVVNMSDIKNVEDNASESEQYVVALYC